MNLLLLLHPVFMFGQKFGGGQVSGMGEGEK